MDHPTADAASTPRFSPPVDLDVPVRRGETAIDKVQVRRPSAGELRGVNIVQIGQMDVAALIKVLPRVTQPSLTEAEVAALDPADFTAVGAELAGFLLTKQQRAEASLD